jgi:AmiR/NasT family two-component response regulator
MIGEATGIIRERFGLTTDQAFGVLRRMSQQHNVKLHQVAQTLVDTGRLPT